MRITVGDLISSLYSYNDDYLICVYEGETSGIVVLNNEGKEVGFIDTEKNS